MKKKIFAGIVIVSVLALGVLAVRNFTSQQPIQEGAYDLYQYHPLAVGNNWIYSVRGLEMEPREVTVRVLREEVSNPKKFKVFEHEEGNFVDFYEESPEGLKRYKDIDNVSQCYGIYEPPAIQYPRYIKIGEKFTRSSIRKDFKQEDGTMFEPVHTEEFTFSLVALEDVSVPYGTFKDCLKTVSDSRLINDKGDEVLRKINLNWNAKDVGVVKNLFIRIEENQVLRFEEGELISAEIQK